MLIIEFAVMFSDWVCSSASLEYLFLFFLVSLINASARVHGVGRKQGEKSPIRIELRHDTVSPSTRRRVVKTSRDCQRAKAPKPPLRRRISSMTVSTHSAVPRDVGRLTVHRYGENDDGRCFETRQKSCSYRESLTAGQMLCHRRRASNKTPCGRPPSADQAGTLRKTAAVDRQATTVSMYCIVATC